MPRTGRPGPSRGSILPGRAPRSGPSARERNESIARAASSPAAPPRPARARKGGLEPLHGRDEPGDPGKVVGQKGERLVQVRPLLLGCSAPRGTRRGRQGRGFRTAGYFSRDFMTWWNATCSLRDAREVAGPSRFFEQARVAELRHRQGRRPQAASESPGALRPGTPAGRRSTARPSGQAVEESLPVGREELHARARVPAVCAPRLRHADLRSAYPCSQRKSCRFSANSCSTVSRETRE